MSTNGLITVVLRGAHRVAQYGHWDHYPAGHGAKALRFCCSRLSTKKGRTAFTAAVDATRFLSREELRQRYQSILGVDSIDWITPEQGDLIEHEMPQLSNSCGADVLSLVADGTVTELEDNSEFARNSTFCSWGYLIDLDNNTFAVVFWRMGGWKE